MPENTKSIAAAAELAHQVTDEREGAVVVAAERRNRDLSGAVATFDTTRSTWYSPASIDQS